MESSLADPSASSFRTLGCHVVQPYRLVHVLSQEAALGLLLSYSSVVSHKSLTRRRDFAPPNPTWRFRNMGNLTDSKALSASHASPCLLKPVLPPRLSRVHTPCSVTSDKCTCRLLSGCFSHPSPGSVPSVPWPS